jgi:WhiB family transcriptional regulator, redox-sensing transcriptional regulator
MMTRPPSWTEQASCLSLATRERDPWHPAVEDRPTYQYAVARRICQGCPVRLECLHEGLDLLTRMPVRGMFGGLTPEELRALAREHGLPARRVADHGTRSRYVVGCRCPRCRRASSDGEHQRRLGPAAAA